MKQVSKISMLIFLAGMLIHISCKRELSCEGCRENNKPPISITGSDQVISLPTDSVLLDGSSSRDPDGQISSWHWTKISGPASFTLTKPSDATTMATSLVPGTYQFELKVTDNEGFSAKDTVQIIMNSVGGNQPPVANAGTDQTITLPIDTILLNGSHSLDRDGAITSYQWTKVLGPSLFVIQSPNVALTKVNGLVQGVYRFELTIRDNGGLFAKDTMQVIVNNPATNQLPITDAGPDQTLTLPLDSAYLDGSGSSPSGWSTIPATFLWTKIGGPSQFAIVPATFLNVSPSLPATTAIAKNLIPGTYLFKLEIRDISGASSADTVQVTVVNDPLDKNTVTFHNLTWMTGDVYGVAEIDNYLNTSLRLDLFLSDRKVKPLEVSLNFDTAPAWISVPFWSGGLYYDGFGEFLWIVNYPVDPSLEGRKSSIKVKLL